MKTIGQQNKKFIFIAGPCVIEGRESTLEIATYLKSYWQVVSELFVDSWGLKPGSSRLMHGVGIWALMFLANVVKNDADEELSVEDVTAFKKNLTNLPILNLILLRLIEIYLRR